MVLKILVGCEESQTVCKAFRELGHEAYSCDLLPSSGGHPEWHFQMDVFEALELKEWDLFIAHPECTFLTVTGNKWFYHPEDQLLEICNRRPHPRFPDRQIKRENAIDFFIRICSAKTPFIAVENPVGIMSTKYKKPQQIIQPWQFGDPFSKTTCLWLKGLPALQHTNIVDKGERVVYASGKSHSKWYADAASGKDKEERRRLRSVTFPGIAKAMAAQWSEYVINQKLIQDLL